MNVPPSNPTEGSPAVAAKYVAVLFDIDGTLINSGGAGAASWRLAFDELYGIPADIGKYTDTGMTDPDVGRQTFAALLHREPTRAELAAVLGPVEAFDCRLRGRSGSLKTCCGWTPNPPSSSATTPPRTGTPSASRALRRRPTRGGPTPEARPADRSFNANEDPAHEAGESPVREDQVDAEPMTTTPV